MATERAPMLADDRAATALDFLAISDAEFADGDRMQASEKLWGAATQALIAVADQRGWPHDSRQELKVAARRLGDEQNDHLITGGFGIAEKFHANFSYDFMEDFQLDADRPLVHDFVHRVLALLR